MILKGVIDMDFNMLENLQKVEYILNTNMKEYIRTEVVDKDMYFIFYKRAHKEYKKGEIIMVYSAVRIHFPTSWLSNISPKTLAKKIIYKYLETI